jgi:hypothetical protein
MSENFLFSCRFVSSTVGGNAHEPSYVLQLCMKIYPHRDSVNIDIKQHYLTKELRVFHLQGHMTCYKSSNRMQTGGDMQENVLTFQK